MNFYTTIKESLRFAFTSLRANPMRTLLSSFGVIMGIFCIIGIFTFVDAMRNEFKRTLSSFANPQRIIIEKWSWQLGGGSYPWWNYIKRPQPKYVEYQFLKERLTQARAVAMQAGPVTMSAKHRKNTARVRLIGVTYDYDKLDNLNIAQGRYFSFFESETGRDVAVVGRSVAEELGFYKDEQGPLGRRIMLRGRYYRIIGVLERQGRGVFGGFPKDEAVYIPYRSAIKIVRVGGHWWVSSRILVDGFESDKKVMELEGELRMLMRARRALRPAEDDNFALNKAEMLFEFVNRIMGLIAAVGAVIGSFSIVVGAFNIANIMFISVQERTFQIGLQKSLGAPRLFIMLQFLFEAIFLTVFGGSVGVFLVYLLSFAKIGGFELSLNGPNLLIGLSICVMTGVLSGLLPAYRAARLDPIEALRT